MLDTFDYKEIRHLAHTKRKVIHHLGFYEGCEICDAYERGNLSEKAMLKTDVYKQNE